MHNVVLFGIMCVNVRIDVYFAVLFIPCGAGRLVICLPVRPESPLERCLQRVREVVKVWKK